MLHNQLIDWWPAKRKSSLYLSRPQHHRNLTLTWPQVFCSRDLLCRNTHPKFTIKSLKNRLRKWDQLVLCPLCLKRKKWFWMMHSQAMLNRKLQPYNKAKDRKEAHLIYRKICRSSRCQLKPHQQQNRNLQSKKLIQKKRSYNWRNSKRCKLTGCLGVSVRDPSSTTTLWKTISQKFQTHRRFLIGDRSVTATFKTLL